MFRRIAAVAFVVAAAFAAIGLAPNAANAQTAAPVADPGGAYYGLVRQPIVFNGANSAGTGLSYSWTFGDGTTAVGATVTKVYHMPGTFAVTLTVTDGLGRRHTAQTTATIGEYDWYRTGYWDGYNGNRCYLTAYGTVVCSYQSGYYDSTPYYPYGDGYCRYTNGWYCDGGYYRVVVPGTVNPLLPAQPVVVPTMPQQTPNSFR